MTDQICSICLETNMTGKMIDGNRVTLLYSPEISPFKSVDS